MDQLQEITGVVDKLVFKNEENGYAVFVLQLKGTNTVTVTGNAPTV